MEAEDRRLRRMEVEQGHYAKQVLDNPLWAQTWENYREALVGRMTDPNSSDEHVLEARSMLIAVDRVRVDLIEALETGNLAFQQLEEANDE